MINISETKLQWFVWIPRWTSLALKKYYSLFYHRTVVQIIKWKSFIYMYIYIYTHTQAGEYVLLIWIEASRFSTNSLKHDIGLE